MSDFRKRDEKIEMGTDRSFGVVFFVVFSLIALYPLINGGPVRMIFLYIAAAFLVVAMVYPLALRPLNWLWMRFALILAMVMNPLIMGILYFFVVTPIALFMRMLGKDFLNLRFDKDSKSYWIERTPPGPPPESMPFQF